MTPGPKAVGGAATSAGAELDSDDEPLVRAAPKREADQGRVEDNGRVEDKGRVEISAVTAVVQKAMGNGGLQTAGAALRSMLGTSGIGAGSPRSVSLDSFTDDDVTSERSIRYMKHDDTSERSIRSMKRARR